MKKSRTEIIGKLMTYEKYKFIEPRLIAEIVEDAFEAVAEAEGRKS